VPPTQDPAFRIPPTESPIFSGVVSIPSITIETQPAMPCTEEELAMETSKGPWPCCVGMSGTECQVYIESKAPDLEVVEIVGENDLVTTDFRTDRVRIFVDESGTCVEVPMRG